jgi:starch phosphorylase
MTTSDRPSRLDLLDPISAHLESGAAAVQRDFLSNLYTRLAKFREVATKNDEFRALAYTVRDRLLQHWLESASTYYERASRTVCYFSAEFLIGPQLAKNLRYLGMFDDARAAMSALGIDIDELIDCEEEPGLGNGGLGRLAACYMDSLATLAIPAIGYGIRYEFGIFDQKIEDGWQREVADKWLRLGNPWEVPRYELEYLVQFGGRTEQHCDAQGKLQVRWIPDRVVKGVPYDTPMLGFGVRNANFLRLWHASAHEEFDVQAFNAGDYTRAVHDKIVSENLTKVLYPNDESEAGKVLRLEQQYFFVSCSLQDMIRLFRQRALALTELSAKYAVQLNDTHPALAVAELMRLLVDEHGLDWESAFEVTTRMFGYTNHTLMPEALESWPLPLFQRVLPRHAEIIFEINRRFLQQVRARFPGDDARLARMSLIDEHGDKRVRMAHLACVGSHAINGVATMHSELLRHTVLADFFELWPERFSNKTNGVTQRRFLWTANPELSALIIEAIGPTWLRHAEELARLEGSRDDSEFRARWRAIKRANKVRLCNDLARNHSLSVDPDTLFDVQVKRIHEYKRQHLNLLDAVAAYQELKAGQKPAVPRTFLFGGKAAPGYAAAKLMIKLIHAVGDVINRDPDTREWLRVVFIPDFNVKVGQLVYPAVDLSEQISTAGTEASGTGNMKLMMNGALTIGTLDGANVEIRDRVGAENMFLFGLTAEQVRERKQSGYRPSEIENVTPELREALDLIAGGFFSHSNAHLFAPLVDELRREDRFMVLADFASYREARAKASAEYADTDAWARKSILNTARSGHFSSDRAIQEYCRDIWRVEAVRLGA